MALFRPRAWKQAVDALQGQRRKKALQAEVGVDQQQPNVGNLKSCGPPQGALHRRPFEFQADEVPLRPLLRPAYQVLTVAEADFHFQRRPRAELPGPVDRHLNVPPRQKRFE